MKKQFILFITLIGSALLFFGFLQKNESDEVSFALRQFREFYTSLDINYVDTLKHDQLILKAINGTIKALDPHSHYYNPKETEKRKKTWRGILYGGIGANVRAT
ncbi:MAG: hypothetical protein JKY42_11405, partial [Flavobacteriales bacterium]|nr:hypothetical protein [Flavobacteriales bacterium]